MRRVVAADGREWVVRRRWLPWQPRWRGRFGFSVDGAGGAWEAFAESVQGPISFVLVVLAVAVGGVVIALLTPLVFLAAELILLFVLLPIVVLRLVLREPWVLIATTKGTPRGRIARSVEGWRASEDALEQLKRDLQLGAGGFGSAR